ncbi:hypothetical protein [Cochleicola gelatinilyticus]|uniref:LSU ribosomal protein L21p n=1 Tax=Cochleicola gelatinilyticus TaxID=1763537 RepID=A0A167J4Y4_9FLAO|nr:hypothetical protein [Cochleicola gelatinilyticus]OAB80341.1 LSU ribosomal protein L21p [Cochleicola gelatinilyticus]
MNLCILIPLLVGLLCALFGYLIGRLFSKNDDRKSEVELWKNKNVQLEADLAACRSKLKSETTLKESPKKIVPEASNTPFVEFNAVVAKEILGKKIKQDDLTVVEGIGPKIRDIFHNQGITTWKDLANSSVEHCKEILRKGGERFVVHNPGTWPRQAKMAYEGKWKELKAWQDILDKGKE